MKGGRLGETFTLQAWLAGLGAAGVLSIAGHALAQASGPDQLHAILKDYDTFYAKADPIGAGQRGDLAAAALWPDDSPRAEAERLAQNRTFRRRLDAVPASVLTGEDALNQELLSRQLDLDIQGSAFDEDRIPFTNDEGFFVTSSYAAESVRIHNEAEAKAWLTRIATLPDYYATKIANMRRGLATDFVSPSITAKTAAKATRAQADLPVEQSPLLQPFDSLPAAMRLQRDALRAQALELIRARVKPAEQRLAAFFADDYLPHARTTLGASALPDGRAYYAYRVRRETTTDMTPDQIFTLGLSEIARIRAAMAVEIQASGFQGTFAAFLQKLRTDPKFYLTSREALMERASRLAKRVDDQLPAYFGKLPRLSYGVREVPRAIEDGYTSARYDPGSPEQGVAGGLMINTSHLDQRPLYELPALVSHEGAPGHHIQIALGQELVDTPLFRKDGDITAFVEGWALYSEQLTREMGLYETPYDRFGLLSMEMWRACRLVMDVGVHWKGWTREQAVACLKDNSALSDKNIQNETDRYIGWPAQALGYKIGELKIAQLRDRARAALGPRFDYRNFHDVVLDEGAMPLNILERRVDAWIAVQKART
ncbi:DUF885 family protein [Caulobacter sp. S45]|uniref:DUF885 domain-containing protein n=1 Tax=Caulobacter sp. S45 TaxID=1641861 RepID=UPI0015770F7F|nr:DUF885 family protein [Caulobacter sp. S45]